MRFRFVLQAIASTLAIVSLTTCAGSSTSRAESVDGTAARSEGLVLQIGEGERRVRRNADKGPFILKVDRQNGGSPELVMGYETSRPALRSSFTDISLRMRSSSSIAAEGWQHLADAIPV